MIEATIDMLLARHREHVAYVGVVGALFCENPAEAIGRLENCRDAAREYARTLNGNRDRDKVRLARLVASAADDLIPGIRQLAASREDDRG